MANFNPTWTSYSGFMTMHRRSLLTWALTTMVMKGGWKLSKNRIICLRIPTTTKSQWILIWCRIKHLTGRTIMKEMRMMAALAMKQKRFNQVISPCLIVNNQELNHLNMRMCSIKTIWVVEMIYLCKGATNCRLRRLTNNEKYNCRIWFSHWRVNSLSNYLTTKCF